MQLLNNESLCERPRDSAVFVVVTLRTVPPARRRLHKRVGVEAAPTPHVCPQMKKVKHGKEQWLDKIAIY